MPPRKLVLTVVAALTLAPACTKGKPRKPSAKPTASPATTQASFRAGQVRAVDAGDRQEANGAAADAAAKVIDVVNSYYTIAFLDPNRWSRGAHPDLASLFTAETQAGVGPNLQGLALAELAPKVSQVEPMKQEASLIKVVIEQDLSAPVAVVTTVFEGMAKTENRSEGPVKIVHTAALWLIRQGDSYKIHAFGAELKANSTGQAGALGSLGLPFHRSVTWGRMGAA